MRILITGSHGLVGTALVPALAAHGVEVIPLVRATRSPDGDGAWWDLDKGEIDLRHCGKLDAVIHLAGENLAHGRWTPERKRRILESRVNGTQLLCGALAGLPAPRPVLLSASATGYYGDRGAEVLREESPAGAGFLAQVCQQWEAATAPAVQAGIRVATLRFGIILAAHGGALAKMLTPFRLGLGGRLGDGSQFWSWIGLEDVMAAIWHVLITDSLSGPVNMVSLEPVPNRQFARTLAEVLGRPAWLATPAIALRLALGEMADEALLASARVVPGKLLAAGFQFKLPTLRSALLGELRPGVVPDSEPGR